MPAFMSLQIPIWVVRFYKIDSGFSNLGRRVWCSLQSMCFPRMEAAEWLSETTMAACGSVCSGFLQRPRFEPGPPDRTKSFAGRAQDEDCRDDWRNRARVNGDELS